MRFGALLLICFTFLQAQALFWPSRWRALPPPSPSSVSEGGNEIGNEESNELEPRPQIQAPPAPLSVIFRRIWMSNKASTEKPVVKATTTQATTTTSPPTLPSATPLERPVPLFFLLLLKLKMLQDKLEAEERNRKEMQMQESQEPEVPSLQDQMQQQPQHMKFIVIRTQRISNNSPWSQGSLSGSGGFPGDDLFPTPQLQVDRPVTTATTASPEDDSDSLPFPFAFPPPIFPTLMRPFQIHHMQMGQPRMFPMPMNDFLFRR